MSGVVGKFVVPELMTCAVVVVVVFVAVVVVFVSVVVVS